VIVDALLYNINTKWTAKLLFDDEGRMGIYMPQ
jgi:hypothetical protein